jgi:hypothetical protein
MEIDERDKREFSWVNLFLVTGFSFLGFSGLLTLLNGAHILIFFGIGITSVVLGCVAFLNKWLSRKFLSRETRTTQTN